MNTRYLTILATLAFLGFSVPAAAQPCDRDPEHKHCDPGDPPSPSITYTAKLIGKAFHFDQVDVVPHDKKDHLLPIPAATLTFTRPDGVDSVARATWDAVFAACENFFAPPVVDSFEVPAENWRIVQPGGVRVQLTIPFDIYGKSPPEGDQHFHVWLQLIGNTLFDNPNDSFLPVPEGPVEYELGQSWITGKTEKGVRPKIGCVSGGSADITIFTPSTESALLITATPTG